MLEFFADDKHQVGDVARRCRLRLGEGARLGESFVFFEPIHQVPHELVIDDHERLVPVAEMKLLLQAGEVECGDDLIRDIIP